MGHKYYMLNLMQLSGFSMPKISTKLIHLTARLCLTLVVFSSLMMVSAKAVSAATYYVSSTGSDSNNGLSVDTPWAHHPWDASATNTAAGTILLDGDQVLFKRGEAFLSVSISVDEGGTSSNIITGAYGDGDRPILSGGSTYPIIASGKNYLTFQDLDLRSDSTVATIFVLGSSNNITIQRNDISNTTARAIYVSSSDTIIIDGNEIVTGSSTGVGIDLNTTNTITISDNTLTNTNVTKTSTSLKGIYLQNSEFIVVSGNTIGTSSSNSYLECIQIKDTDSSSIYENNVSYCWNGLDYPSAAGHGVYLSFSSENNDIYKNFFLESPVLDEVASGNGGNNYYYNIVKNSHVNGIDFRGASTVNPSGIYNNIVLHHPTGTAGHGINIQLTGKKVIIKNNTITCDVAGSNIQCVALAGDYTSVEINNNLYYPTNGAQLGKVGGTDYDDFNEWKQALQSDSLVSGKDENSVSANPLFTDPGNSDLSLQALSPAIDAGTDVGLLTDYLGNPIYGTPDIGAYEYQPTSEVTTNEIDIDGDVRIYADGKFRNTQTPSGTTANLAITPDGGFGTGDYSEWMNLTISEWNTSGDYAKTWTESSDTIGSDATVHTVGDLQANSQYVLKVDDVQGADITSSDCTAGICTADSSGEITFTYTGGYSTHTFSITQYTPPSSPVQIAENHVSAPGLSPARPPTCDSTTPVGLPDLFQINRSGNQATLYFTPVNDYVKNYHVVFGFKEGDERFGLLSAEVTSETNNGVQSVTIHDLDPKAQYFFKVAPVNGCAVGTWSNWLKADKVIQKTSIFYRYFSPVKEKLRT